MIEHSSRPELVVGLGSPRGDDRAGWVAAKRLESLGFEVATARNGSELLRLVEDRAFVVVIDAAMPAGSPGRITALDWPSDRLVESIGGGTHGLGLVQALRMADVLADRPRRVRIYTIEALAAGELDALSTPVEQAIECLVEQIKNIASASHPGSR